MAQMGSHRVCAASEVGLGIGIWVLTGPQKHVSQTPPNLFTTAIQAIILHTNLGSGMNAMIVYPKEPMLQVGGVAPNQARLT